MKQPAHKIRVPDDVASFIRRIHPHIKKKIKACLKGILSDPNSGKALKDDLTGLRSVHVSRFRIIYRISKKKEIEIIAIGPRQRIYEETFWILNKNPEE